MNGSTLYTDGTVALTNGSATITGTGTAWLTNMQDGGVLLLPDGGWYEVAFTSDTAGTLSAVYAGTTASGQSYVAFKTPSIIKAANSIIGIATDYRGVLFLTGGSNVVKLNKTDTDKSAGVYLRKNGTDAFRAGLFGSDDYRVQRWDGTAWQDGLKIAASDGAVTIDGVNSGNRETLTAARTYYVRTDGSDSNNGLANTTGGAFLTVQHAIDTVAQLDSAIYDVTIQIAAGTYTTSTGLVAKRMAGAGQVIIVGDETTPANVILTTNGAMDSLSDGALISDGVTTAYHLRGVKLTTTSSGTPFGLYARHGSVIRFQNVDFGSGHLFQIRASDLGAVEATGDYSISSGAQIHWSAQNGSIRVQLRTITLTGTPAFSGEFLSSASLGMAFVDRNTFSGSATGPRYNAVQNSVIQTFAASTYLPGDTAGTTDTGGQYT